MKPIEKTTQFPIPLFAFGSKVRILARSHADRVAEVKSIGYVSNTAPAYGVLPHGETQVIHFAEDQLESA